MIEKLDKQTVQYYLNKVTQDFTNIQARIAQSQQEIEEAKEKYQKLKAQCKNTLELLIILLP